ncbi:tigger transposable element-derived protein 6-like protein [Plakobranchus ocellatus]|uniref:Tigger transposable element-derived protein 6-like protein n=1 Tax=Plakobranchus ocellatus TaxID=259542 RepID=A0AAV4BYI5_9GAST|nr:tigger transposable element-derived protein 6-like protein [Plakobranchus ocellatus]
MERTVLGVERENLMTNWLEESARRGFDHTKKQLIATVQNCLDQERETTPFKGNKPGEKWYRLFRQCHKDKLAVRTPQSLGSQRAAVSIGIKKKVLAAKTDKYLYQVSNDTHQQVTVLVCGNAAGKLEAPPFIFPGQQFSYDPMEGFPEAYFAKSGNGWIDSEIFAKWLATGFVPAMSHLQKSVVLFADGHSTHLTLAIHQICKDNEILLHQLPSHSCHIVQPLDLTTFKNLKQAWDEEVMKFQEENSDTLAKQHFAKAWDKPDHDGDVLRNGYRASGIFPWNPQQFDGSKLAPHRMFVEASHEVTTDKTQDKHLETSEGTCTVTETCEVTVTETDTVTQSTETETNEIMTSAGTSEMTEEPTNDEQTESVETAYSDKRLTTNSPDSIFSSDIDMTSQTAVDRLLHLTARAGRAVDWYTT